MTVARFTLIDNTLDDADDYKDKLDANMQALQQIAAQFQCVAQLAPNMTVQVQPGVVTSAPAGVVAIGAQNSSAIVAPVSNPRIDRVIINGFTGVASLLTGAEAASPVPPTVPVGSYPCSQIALTVGMLTITNFNITDERSIGFNLVTYSVTNRELERTRTRARLFAAQNFC